MGIGNHDSICLFADLSEHLLDDELWFDSCEFIKRPKQVKGKNSDSDVVASQASIILEGISEKYQDKGKLDRDYEQHQEAHAETSRKEPPKSPGTVETATPIDNKEPVNVKVNIHTEINPEPSEILDVLADESEPIVPPAPKAASTPQNADAAEPFDSADIFESEPEPEPKPEKESVFDLPVDDDDTQDPFAENPTLVCHLTPAALTWMMKRTRSRTMMLTYSILPMMWMSMKRNRIWI